MAPIKKENIFSNVFYNSGLMGRIEELIMRESKLISAIEVTNEIKLNSLILKLCRIYYYLCKCRQISKINVSNICANYFKAIINYYSIN